MAKMEPCLYCDSTRSRRGWVKVRGKLVSVCTNDAQCERRCGQQLKARP